LEEKLHQGELSKMPRGNPRADHRKAVPILPRRRKVGGSHLTKEQKRRLTLGKKNRQGCQTDTAEKGEKGMGGGGKGLSRGKQRNRRKRKWREKKKDGSKEGKQRSCPLAKLLPGERHRDQKAAGIQKNHSLHHKKEKQTRRRPRNLLKGRETG